MSGYKLIAVLFAGASLFFGLALLTAALLPFPVQSTSAEKHLNLTVLLEKDAFEVGEPIPIELRLRYGGTEPLTLSFSSSQRFDFQIETQAGEIVWRWSEGKMFAQALGQVTLSPNQPEVRYHAVFRGRLSPGQYVVRGILAAQPRSRSSGVQITVQ